MFFCNKQAKVCENCDFLLTFAHLRDFCFAKSLIFIKDLRNLREVELGVADVDVGLREGYLNAALVEGVVDVLLDARQVGQTCLDRGPQHHHFLIKSSGDGSPAWLRSFPPSASQKTRFPRSVCCLYLMIFDCLGVKKCPPPKPLNLIKVHQIICNCLLMILGFGLLYQMRVNVGE